MERPEDARPNRIKRFTVSDRIEHWIQVISFTALGVTGLVQRYDGAALSRKIIDWFGGIESLRVVHRAFATVLMIAVVYHFGMAGYRWYVQRRPRSMLPTKADAVALKGTLQYTFGRKPESPPQGRFTWEEKIEYWAFVWGTLVMVATGFLLWNPIGTTSIFPGEFVPVAKAAHSGEALLAVLSVIVWHMYHVHVRNWNTSMFTGYMSRELMEEEHPLSLAAIDRRDYVPPSKEEQRARAKRYLPIYGVVSLVMLAGIFWFVTFENTAIETIDPIEHPAIFAPVETLPPHQTTTSTTLAGTTTTVPGETTTTVVASAPTWDDPVVGFFETSCVMCHGPGGSAGLDLTSFDAAQAGGSGGPGFVPGDPTAGTIVPKMLGSHPGVLMPEQFAIFTDWLDAGAPETADDAGAPVDPRSAATWDDPVGAFFADTCAMCHGPGGSAGLDLTSYGSALAGGNSGPGFVPGDPTEGMIVAKTESGAHPGLLTPEQFAVFTEWLAAGAPETADDVAVPGETTTTTTAPAVVIGSWDEDFETLLGQRCTACHSGESPMVGLSLESYEGLLAGGDNGPVVESGDPSASTLYLLMEAGQHASVVTGDDLEALRLWIEAGLPRTVEEAAAASVGGGGGTTATTIAAVASASEGWDVFEAAFAESCVNCHGANLVTSGLDLSTYDTAKAGGTRGSGIVPGDPDAGVIVQMMEAGGHPGQLSDTDLAALREWIAGLQGG